jgi:hypothetical protein
VSTYHHHHCDGIITTRYYTSTTTTTTATIIHIDPTTTSTKRSFSSAVQVEEEASAPSSPSSSSAQTHPHHTGPLWDSYYALLKTADVHADEHQLAALESLERLRQDLQHYHPPKDIVNNNTPSPAKKLSSTFGGWFSMGVSPSTTKKTAHSHTAGFYGARGVYLHGGVGCGKTFVMNLFYDSITGNHPWANNKQKIHFHKFMLQVHQAMHMARKNEANHKESDAILPSVIAETVKQGRLICLDEFQGKKKSDFWAKVGVKRHQTNKTIHIVTHSCVLVWSLTHVHVHTRSDRCSRCLDSSTLVYRVVGEWVCRCSNLQSSTRGFVFKWITARPFLALY